MYGPDRKPRSSSAEVGAWRVGAWLMADILVVGDEEALRRLIAHMLRAAGHTVREAEDGRQALAHFDQRLPALLITAAVLPRQQGFQTIIELHREMPDLPILAILGDRGEIDPRLTKGGGAIASLGKPFSADALLGAVTRLLGTRTA